MKIARAHLPYVAAFLLATVDYGQTAPSAPDELVTLSPFSVTALHSVGYGVQDASSSSRLNLPYIDTPQSISVMTPEFLSDANIFTSREVLKWVNNVIPRTNGSANETFEVRGLIITDTYRDGMLTSANITRDAALYDRIEYVKGPASASIGRGQAGGMVNYVTKKPEKINRSSAKTIVGTDRFSRFELDLNRIVTPNLTVRLPIYYEDGDGTYGGALSRTRKWGAGPSLLWDISKKSQLLINTTAFHYEGPGQSAETDFFDGRDGTIFRLRQSVGQDIGSVWNPYDFPEVPKKNGWGFYGIGRTANVGEISGVFTHAFSDLVSIRHSFLYDVSEEEVRSINKIANTVANPNDPKEFLIPLLYTRALNDAKQMRIQGDVLLNKKIGESSNQWVIGYDWFDRNNTAKTGSRQAGLFDELYHPRHIPPSDFDFIKSAPLITKTYTWGDGVGFHAGYLGSYWQDKIKLIAGIRRDTTEFTTRNLITGADTTVGKKTTTAPRYSLSYKPVKSMSIYYVRSHQEDPAVTQLRYANFISSNGAVVPPPNDPRRSELITGQLKAVLDEVGVKGNFLNDRLTASVSLYRIRREGALQATPVNQPVPTAQFPQAQLVWSETYVTSGEEYKGAEVEVTGRVNKNLTFLAAYSIPKGVTVFNGKLSPGGSLIRRAMFFGKYNLFNAAHEGWETTLGFRELFGHWTIRSNSAVKFEYNQYSVDAGVAYYWNHGRYSARIAGNNLTNDPQMTGTNSNVELRRFYSSLTVNW